MKRAGRILSLLLLIVMLASSFCFADSLKLESSYPENGYMNAAIENFGIKLYFNQDVQSKEFEKHNEKCFVIKDAKGKVIPSLVVYSDKEEGMVMVLADMTNKKVKITESTKYTLTISGDFTAANGETLGKDEVIKLTTLNQSKSMKVNMVLMVVMFGAIMFFGTKTEKHKEEKKESEQKVNPYKVAKETGKSVEEVVEKDKKRKERQAAADARRAAKEQHLMEEIEEEYEEYDPFRKKVKRPHPISEGGSTYITGRKAEAEKARTKGTTNPKHKGGSKKHKK